MKKIISVVFIILMISLFISCKNNQKYVPEIDVYATTEEITTETQGIEKSEIIVFADNSLQGIMETIKQDYESKYADTNIIYQFDTSESLKNKIVNIEDCDVFISSDSSILDSIDITKVNDVNIEGFDFIEPDSRVVVFEDNELLDNSDTFEACIIRIGLNIEEAKRFVDYLKNIE